jgi:hypothetical protein
LVSTAVATEEGELNELPENPSNNIKWADLMAAAGVGARRVVAVLIAPFGDVG